MDFYDIPEDELNDYFRRLVPKLLRQQPLKWIPISSIANDVCRFCEIVQLMANHGLFNDNRGCCMVEISKDSYGIRIREDNIMLFRSNNLYKWKFDTD